MRRYPKLMFINLIHENFFGDAVKCILESISSLRFQLLQDIVQRRESFCLLLLMIASSPGEAASTILNRITGIPGLDQTTLIRESTSMIDEDILNCYRSLLSECRIGKIKP